MSGADPERTADRLRIIENLARYHHAVDDKDWDTLHALFTEDVTAEYRSLNSVELFGLEGVFEGRETVVDWIRVGQEPFRFNGAPTHFMTNHVIRFSGTTAASRSSFNDIDLISGLAIGTGTYHCDHEQTEGGWKISRLALHQRLCDGVVQSIIDQRNADRSVSG